MFPLWLHYPGEQLSAVMTAAEMCTLLLVTRLRRLAKLLMASSVTLQSLFIAGVMLY